MTESKMTLEAATALRRPFPPESVGQLPKPYSKDSPRGDCKECGGYHGLPAVHLDYVGHAAVTDRLLTVDPEWTWEPMAITPEGLPALDRAGNLWIRLTVCGVTRIGVGDGRNAKEVIGDALRNAAMRFGLALDLWAKENLVEFAQAARSAAEPLPPARPTRGPSAAPGSVVPAAPVAAREANAADAAFEAFAPEAAAREAAERIAAETGLAHAHKQPAGGDVRSGGEDREAPPSAGGVSPASPPGVEGGGGVGTDAPAPPRPVVVPRDPDYPERSPKKAGAAQKRMIFATLTELGVYPEDRYTRLLVASYFAGRPIGTFDDLTTTDASRVIDGLTKVPDRAAMSNLLATIPTDTELPL